MALIFMPQESSHSGTVLIIFLLAGCLSYSNSTMNPILYAFLSENFKKSFKKACHCASEKVESPCKSCMKRRLHYNIIFRRGGSNIVTGVLLKSPNGCKICFILGRKAKGELAVYTRTGGSLVVNAHVSSPFTSFLFKQTFTQYYPITFSLLVDGRKDSL